MKKILAAFTLVGFLWVATPAEAQVVKKTEQGVKKGAKKVWKGTKKGAKAVGNKTAETATKAKAKMTDKKSSEWVGPEGQTIYVDDGNKYYWIDKKGARVFVSQDQLKKKS